MPNRTFLDEAIARREAIASQLAHLDEHDETLRKGLEQNARNRVELLTLDDGYKEAIDRAQYAGRKQ